MARVGQSDFLTKLLPTYYDLYEGVIQKRNGTMLACLAWFGTTIAGTAALARGLRHWELLAPFVLMFVGFLLLA